MSSGHFAISICLHNAPYAEYIPKTYTFQWILIVLVFLGQKMNENQRPVLAFQPIQKEVIIAKFGCFYN